MPPASPRRNRGPAAAAQNRQAILSAARRLFAERGLHVPLQTVAQTAAVGQGVLYRHFPTRASLAFAVFDENLAAIEQLAADPDERTFARIWSHLVDLIVENAAFVDMAVAARDAAADYDGADRLTAGIAPALRVARDSGTVEEHLTIEDVVLALRMLYGVTTTCASTAEAASAVARARRLLPQSLRQ